MTAPTESRLPSDYATLCDAIGTVHRTCHRGAATVVNLSLTLRNWLIGAYIVEYEQHGSDRARYGEGLLAQLASDLTSEFGRGFGVRILREMRRFYLAYPQLGLPIRQSPIAEFLPAVLTSFADRVLDFRQSAIA